MTSFVLKYYTDGAPNGDAEGWQDLDGKWAFCQDVEGIFDLDQAKTYEFTLGRDGAYKLKWNGASLSIDDGDYEFNDFYRSTYGKLERAFGDGDGVLYLNVKEVPSEGLKEGDKVQLISYDARELADLITPGNWDKGMWEHILVNESEGARTGVLSRRWASGRWNVQWPSGRSSALPEGALKKAEAESVIDYDKILAELDLGRVREVVKQSPDIDYERLAQACVKALFRKLGE